MVKISARFDEATMLPGFREHLRWRKIRRKMGRYALFTGTAFLLSLLPFLFGSRGVLWWQLMMGGGTAVSIWIFFSFDRIFVKALRKNLSYGKMMEWTLEPQRFLCETEGSRTEVSWANLFEVREGKDGFLIYPQEGLFHYLPFSGFSSPEDISEARSYFPADKVKP